MANQRSERAKRCKKGLRHVFSTTVIFTSTTTSQGASYFNGVIREKIKKGTRDAIAFDRMACTVTFISKLAEDPKPIEAG